MDLIAHIEIHVITVIFYYLDWICDRVNSRTITRTPRYDVHYVSHFKRECQLFELAISLVQFESFCETRAGTYT